MSADDALDGSRSGEEREKEMTKKAIEAFNGNAR